MTKSVLIRIYLEEGQRHKGVPAHTALLQHLRRQGYAGATVLRGVEGFGRSQTVHTADLVDLASSLPLVVEIIESQERAHQLQQELTEAGWMKGTLMTIEPVTAARL